MVSAQSRSDIPGYALPCLDDAVKDTKCSTDDFACICQHVSAIQSDATSCILEKCGRDIALNKVVPATQALCRTAGKGSSGPSYAPIRTGSASTTDAGKSNGTSLASNTVKADAAGVNSIAGHALLALGVLAL
ncbi:CFEM domain-containing protein [Purpureocillium lavendulum]|uniref:CFEM domain-containing protein n=1 Tax=Purpureocillium lavendulum TaxID=1247861 RepID=A0AB34FEB4_9HYPO|nr:CFEM domain-containing protein [Purpureocillium lavendulum]KAJ6437014.1 CFEM domain-containing protein [Purpureocillium lavendulum]